jgi:hypothetical protein
VCSIISLKFSMLILEKVNMNDKILHSSLYLPEDFICLKSFSRSWMWVIESSTLLIIF